MPIYAGVSNTMAVLIVPFVCRFYVDFTLGGRPASVIVDATIADIDGSRPVNIEKTARMILAAWHAGPRSRQSNQITCVGVSWLDLNSATGSTGQVTTGPGGTPSWPADGGFDAVSMPSNVALRVDKLTLSRRGHRGGRMYVPGMPESDTDVPNTVAASRVTAWQAEFTEFFNAINGAVVTGTTIVIGLSVVHVPQSGDPDWSPMNGYRVTSTVRSQGRRLRK